MCTIDRKNLSDFFDLKMLSTQLISLSPSSWCFVLQVLSHFLKLFQISCFIVLQLLCFIFLYLFLYFTHLESFLLELWHKKLHSFRRINWTLKVRVIRLWILLEFKNPNDTSSIELFLLDEKITLKFKYFIFCATFFNLKSTSICFCLYIEWYNSCIYQEKICWWFLESTWRRKNLLDSKYVGS